MKERGLLARAGRAVLRLALIELGIVAALLAVALLLGWHSTNEIALLLTLAGAFIFAFGPFSLLGGWGTTRNWVYLYARTMEDNTAEHRRRQDAREVARDAGLVLPSIVLGVLTMAIGAFVPVVF